MALTFHQVSVPVFERSLKALSACLDKAAAHAEASKFELEVLTTYRLFPDMFPFWRQVHQANLHARRGSALPAGMDFPKIEAADVTLPQLKAMTDATVEFLGKIDPAAMDDSREVTIVAGGNERKFPTALEYLLTHAMPNFYFHVTTAYDILRHNGVVLGKRDFIG
jgi:uncharacterized protein